MNLNIIYYIYIYTHYTIIYECIYRDYKISRFKSGERNK